MNTPNPTPMLSSPNVEQASVFYTPNNTVPPQMDNVLPKNPKWKNNYAYKPKWLPKLLNRNFDRVKFSIIS